MTNTQTMRVTTAPALTFDGHETDRLVHLATVGIMALRDDVKALLNEVDRLNTIGADSGAVALDRVREDFVRSIAEGEHVLAKIESLRYIGTLAFVGEPEDVETMCGDLAEQAAGCDCGKGLYCPLVQAR